MVKFGSNNCGSHNPICAVMILLIYMWTGMHFYDNFFPLQMCRLGKHVPFTGLRDGILRVGKNSASKVADLEAERWFELIGDFPSAALLKLYSQVSA